MNILILTGKFGMGHASTARALEQRIAKELPQARVTVADIMEETVGRASASVVYHIFETVVRHGGTIYNKIYRSCNRESNMPIPARQRFIRAIGRLVARTEPQVVISTLPLCTRLAAEYKERGHGRYTMVSCITDISCHSEWIAPGVDLYCVASAHTKAALVRAGVDQNRILITGVPVRPAFRVPGAGERQAKRVLVMGGGLGLMPEDPEFYLRLAAIPGVRVTAITGGNQDLYEKLRGLAPIIEVLPFVQNVDEYMRRSDVMISKPGGITLFEAVASDLPLLAFHPALEQEKLNAAFLKEHHIGTVLPESPEPMLWVIEDLLLSPTALAEMRRNMAALRRTMRLDALLDRLDGQSDICA